VLLAVLVTVQQQQLVLAVDWPAAAVVVAVPYQNGHSQMLVHLGPLHTAGSSNSSHQQQQQEVAV
jgi:hypothetical protein